MKRSGKSGDAAMATAPARQRKVIITCAVTGAIHTPSMSPHLPVTPEQIAEAAIDAADAGAAIVHLHARDPDTGRPDQSPEAFGRFLSRIKQRTGAVVNLTTGGAPYMTVQERVQPAATFKPEVASLNMGSMNFGLFPMLDRFEDSYRHGSQYRRLVSRAQSATEARPWMEERRRLGVRLKCIVLRGAAELCKNSIGSSRSHHGLVGRRA
jgi:uncharacterized protein (DUF849 family)